MPEPVDLFVRIQRPICGAATISIVFFFFFLSLFSCVVHAQNGSVDQLLEMDMTELLDLKVDSALKVPETINKVPATVRVITAEQIRENGYFTLEQALADLPGFQFRNILGFNSYIFIRGVPSQNNKILLLVDGIEANELNSGGFYGGAQFDMASVQRIEVVYGPASALYGTNAVSGIINVVTRSPRDERGGGGGGHIAAGNFSTEQADVRYSRYDPKKEWGFNFSAMYKDSNKADLKGAEGDWNWSRNLDNFENDVAVNGKFEYKDFSAGLLLQDKDASRATMLATAPSGPILFSDHGVNWHIRFINTWATYVYDRGKPWSVRSTAYYRDSTVLDDTIPTIEAATASSPGRQFRYYRPGHRVGDETRMDLNAGKRWQFSGGVVLEQERLAKDYSITTSSAEDMLPAEPPAPRMIDNSLVSLYGQARVSLTPGLDLFAGLRHDDSSYYGSVDTPRLALVLNRGKYTAKALFTKAFRAPRPWDYTDGLGNPDLEPEKMQSIEAAFAWSPSPHYRFEVSVYDNRLDGLLTRQLQADSWMWINTGRLDTIGTELSAEMRRGPWKAYVNYTYTDSKNEDGIEVAEISPHTANAGVDYKFAHQVNLSVRGQFLGQRTSPKVIPATGTETIDAAFVLGAAALIPLPYHFDVQLIVDNVLNTVYYHPSNLPPSRYRQPQRTFRTQLGYSF